MSDEIALRIPRLFVGQLIVALEEERQNWDCTVAYLTDGCVPTDRMAKEASSAQDAKKMVQFYEGIIDCIQRQLPEPAIT